MLVFAHSAFPFAPRKEDSSFIPLATARFWRLNINNVQLRSISVNNELEHMRYIVESVSPPSPALSLKHYLFLFSFISFSSLFWDIVGVDTSSGVQLKNGYCILLRQGQKNSSQHWLQMCKVVTLGSDDN